MHSYCACNWQDYLSGGDCTPWIYMVDTCIHLRRSRPQSHQGPYSICRAKYFMTIKFNAHAHTIWVYQQQTSLFKSVPFHKVKLGFWARLRLTIPFLYMYHNRRQYSAIGNLYSWNSRAYVLVDRETSIQWTTCFLQQLAIISSSITLQLLDT